MERISLVEDWNESKPKMIRRLKRLTQRTIHHPLHTNEAPDGEGRMRQYLCRLRLFREDPEGSKDFSTKEWTPGAMARMAIQNLKRMKNLTKEINCSSKQVQKDNSDLKVTPSPKLV